MILKIRRKIGLILPKPIKNTIKKVFRFSVDIKILNLIKRTVPENRYLLLLTPEHANIGDHAIAISEKKFMAEFFPEKLLVEIPLQTWMLYKKRICKYIKKEETVLVHGGGFLGTLWMDGEKEFRSILKRLPENRIVVFPQTVYFDKSSDGKEQLTISKDIYSKHENLFFCVRDNRSYRFIQDNNMLKDISKCYLLPDMVTFINDFDNLFTRENIVLMCIRDDHERETSLEHENEILNIFEKTGVTVKYTNTVISHYIKPANRYMEVNDKMKEFAGAKLVITDRLHGMLLSAITGTPCLFMDNCSRKVSGAYEWIKDLEYVKFLEDAGQLEKFWDSVSENRRFKYTNEHLKEYFEILVSIISG